MYIIVYILFLGCRLMSSEEYDLKKSEAIIGQLYPVLLSKDGRVIDVYR